MSLPSLMELQRRAYKSLFSEEGLRCAGFWMFDATKDNQNDTPEKCPGLVCRELDGKVFRKTDLVARKLFPPVHDGCRCSAIEFDDVDLKRKGLRVSEGKEFSQ